MTALTPSGPQISVKYVLTGPDGTRAVFNDPTDADYVGALSAITGLDSAEVRENAENISGQDGGVHGDFLYGRRPIVLTGLIYNVTSPTDRNKKQTKLQEASNALREDAVLTWTPEGGEEQQVKVRRQQPLRITGGWTKEFNLSLVSPDSRIYSVAESLASGEVTGAAATATGTTPENIVISPDGKHAYVVNQGSATVGMYERNTGTGKLKALGTPTIATGTTPQGIVISADGKNVYVTNRGSNTLSRYNRNEASGVLTSQGAALATGTEPIDLAITPNGNFLVVTNYGSHNLTVMSRTTTTTTFVETTAASAEGKNPYPLAFAPVVEGSPEYLLLVGFYTNAKIGTFLVNVSTGKVSTEVGYDTFPDGTPGSIVSSPVVQVNTGTGGFTSTTNQWFVLSQFTGKVTRVKGVRLGTTPLPFASEVVSASGAVLGNRKLALLYNSPTSAYLLATYSSSNVVGSGYVNLESGTEPPAGSVSSSVGTDTSPVGLALFGKTAYTTNATGKTLGEYNVATNGVLTPNYTGASTAITCTNKGSTDTIASVTFEVTAEELISPTVTNETTGETVTFNGSFVVGSVVTIDFLNRVVMLNGVSAFGLVNVAGTSWWLLKPGVNKVAIGGFLKPAGKVKLKVKWRSAWA